MGIFGAHGGCVSGEIKLDGKRVSISSPADAIRQGIGFVTEDRKRFGLVIDQTVRNNMTLAALKRIAGRFLTDDGAETAAGDRAMKDLRVKAQSLFTVVGTLSGGNQRRSYWLSGC
jgi:D-xylose transport system ATP-binding protein